MKYRSITLNGNKKYTYSLVKYTDEYKIHLEEFRKVNSELADNVEQCPKIYSEQSDHQCYMIIRDECHCVGAIYIGTSTDEKNLEIKVHFDEIYFETYNDIVALIEQLVDSLSLYFYDKQNIEIELINNIDLSQFNRFRFKKKAYDAKITTYTCSNEKNNILIPIIINEMCETEKNLIGWGQFWMQKFHMCDYRDLNYKFDRQLMEEYDNGTISLPELFFKAEYLSWVGINSHHSRREICFSRSGRVTFSKDSKNSSGLNYEFDYSLLNNDFRFNAYAFNQRPIEINENSYFTNIQSGNIDVLYIKENKRKKIKYTSPIVNRSSIAMELWYNEQNQLERCYIDFRTHKGNNKINGLYELRIVPGYFSRFSLNYTSRDGYKGVDFVHLLPTNLFCAIIPGELTIQLVDQIINESISIINHMASVKHKQNITSQGDCIASTVADIEKQSIEIIKQIKGEIPLPHLQENIEKFIQKNNKIKNEEKKRVLKNN